MKRKTKVAIHRLLALLLAVLTGAALLLPATALGTEELPASEIQPQETGTDALETAATSQVFLEYYVLINDEWERIATQYTAEREGGGSRARFYTTAENLETVYQGFGFRAAEYNGELFFPHTDTENMDTLWADAAPYQTDGQWRIPLSYRNRIFVYYLPNNTPGNAAYFNDSAPRTDEALTGENTFYTVSVSDPSGTETTATGRHYVLTGTAYTVSLTQTEGRTWKTTNLMTGEEVTPDERTEEDGKLRITFDAVTFPLKIASCSESDDGYTIRYHAATLADSLEQLGYIAASQQTVLAEGSIDGAASMEETLGNNQITAYHLRQPDAQTLRVAVSGSSKDKKYEYTFRGWRVAETENILTPDKQLTAAELARYEENGVLVLNAVWSGLDANNRVTSANFYVNVHCEISDNTSNGFQPVEESNFTKSLYCGSLTGTEGIPVSGTGTSDYLFLAPPTSESTAYETDTTLRGMTQQPYSGVMFSDFPTDEDVLRSIRADGYQIELDGVQIPAEKLTTEHFKIRWYVLKYDKSDGWHVDGVLVAKEAHLRVEKTFLGDAQAVAQITAQENDYRIIVSHRGSASGTSNGAIAEDYELTLRSAAEETRAGCLGYSSFDPETNTYVWLPEGHPNGLYSLRESNYTLPGDWHISSDYKIANSENATDGWQEYQDGAVTVRAESYPSDVPSSAYQTVAFRNSYVHSGVLTLFKMDSFSSGGLADVSFTLRAAERPLEVLKLYRKPGTSEYSSDVHSDGYTQPVEDGVVTTDANGNVYLELPAGSYTLQETMPTGYTGAAVIEFMLNEHGEVTELTARTAQGDAITDLTGVASGAGTARLTIFNQSHLLTTVRAEVDWGTTPEAQQAEIMVELYCNGAKLSGPAYTQVLNAANGWSYVWEDLPLFIDGEIAQFSLRESKIGETAYDPEVVPDGYRDYAVSYDPARYRESADGAYMDEATWLDAQNVRHYANHVLLRAHNRLDQGLAAVFVSKQWEDVANQDGLRPESVTVSLWMDGVDTGKTLTLSDANEWSSAFENLRKYENGRLIEYTVVEAPVNGYETEITGNSESGFLVVNTHTPETTEIAVEKTWERDTPEQRPQQIEIRLLADGVVVDSRTVSADAEGKWECTFSALPVYHEGQRIVYTVAEDPVQGYKTVVDGFHITNILNTRKPDPVPKPDPDPEPKPDPDPEPKPDPDPEPKPDPDPEPKPDPKPAPDSSHDAPKTADTSLIYFWLGIALMSFELLAILLLIRKKACRS